MRKLIVFTVLTVFGSTVYSQNHAYNNGNVPHEQEEFFKTEFRNLELSIKNKTVSINDDFIEFLIESSGIPCLQYNENNCVFGEEEIKMWKKWYSKNKNKIIWSEIKQELEIKHKK